MLQSVVLLVVINILCISSQKPCVTPNGERASCKLVYSCPVFINLIERGTYDSDQLKFMTSSVCHRNEKDEPVVCCGSDTRFKSTLPDRSECGYQIDYKVLGGENTYITEFPWAAVLIQSTAIGKEKYSCGGTLISDRYILTAAHCVVNTKNKLIKVRLGDWDLDSQEDCIGTGSQRSCSPAPQNIGIEEIISHEEYVHNSRGLVNDIALIRLATPVTFNEFVKPICLPLPDERSDVGKRLYVAGWGVNETHRSYSPIKQKLLVPIVTLDYCKSKFDTLGVQINDNVICAGGEKDKDACKGDSGGPLMAKAKNDTEQYYIEGVVSFGKLCGLEGWPGVYTRVSEHLDWIKRKVKS